MFCVVWLWLGRNKMVALHCCADTWAYWRSPLSPTCFRRSRQTGTIEGGSACVKIASLPQVKVPEGDRFLFLAFSGPDKKGMLPLFSSSCLTRKTAVRFCSCIRSLRAATLGFGAINTFTFVASCESPWILGRFSQRKHFSFLASCLHVDPSLVLAPVGPFWISKGNQSDWRLELSLQSLRQEQVSGLVQSLEE